ncbi:MAG TPA: amidohydrolase family protein, partial [Acidimicrobiia bacterium]|nr:amidohydrolase family protein [Acidimicrobiia bacterium]
MTRSALLVRGGTVYDGTGAPGRVADVAIADGVVTEIGSGLRGDRELDASGCAVAPGFVDIHTHYDAQVFWDPALRPSSFHGVTTVVAGNCGFTIAPTRPEHHDAIVGTLENVEDMDPATLAAGIAWEFETFPEYLAAVRRRGTLLNFTAYVGHSALRLYVMGDAAYERAATPAEVAQMSALVREAIDAGAAGFSTSFSYAHRGVDGKPVPSRFAERDEVDALFCAAGETGKGVVLITPGTQCSYADVYEWQPRIGRPFTYPLFASPGGRHLEPVGLHEQGLAHGAQVWPQVTPRPLTMQFTLADPYSLNTGT